MDSLADFCRAASGRFARLRLLGLHCYDGQNHQGDPAERGAAVAAQIETLKRVWPGLKARLEEQLVPQAEIARRLRVVGAPVLPEDISISKERMEKSIKKAQAIRRRFTVLDIVLRIGLWDELV